MGAGVNLLNLSVPVTRTPYACYFSGLILPNSSVSVLEDLGSPLARADLASLGNLESLENLNLTSPQQTHLFNLTAMGSKFCQGTEQVESCKSMAGKCETLPDGFFPLR